MYFLVTLFSFLTKIVPDSQLCTEFFTLLSEITNHYCDIEMTSRCVHAFRLNSLCPLSHLLTNDRQQLFSEEEVEAEENLAACQADPTKLELVANLFSTLASMIKEHPIVEKTENSPSDLVLLGASWLLVPTHDSPRLLARFLRIPPNLPRFAGAAERAGINCCQRQWSH